MTTIIKDHEDLKAHVGQHLGYSDYMTVSQEQVQTFADATGDHQWIHIDVEKAKTGPFGQTIAHGYLTLSLAIPNLSIMTFLYIITALFFYMVNP
jgi:acyl dehydratase